MRGNEFVLFVCWLYKKVEILSRFPVKQDDTETSAELSQKGPA